MSQKLSQRARWLRSGVAQSESEAQHGLAAKARFFPIERLCPTLSMAPVLANVLSDVSGMTGQAIIKAILAGEPHPHKLAVFRDPRVKASEEQIARSLEGNWEEDLLFVLKQEQDGYEFCQQQMTECDRQSRN